MKPTLVLCLGSEHLSLQVRQSAPEPGLRDFLRRLFRSKPHWPSAKPAQELARVDVALSNAPASLSTWLEQALAELKVNYTEDLKGLELEVQLGLRYARIGLLTLADASVAASASANEAYTQAWVRQMWHLEPDSQIIRWDQGHDPYTLLISSIERATVDSLNEFAKQQGLRFISCKPAVLSAMNSASWSATGAQATSAIEQTIVWTEAGTHNSRASRVQLLRMKGSKLSADWRGWVPIHADADGNDVAIEGALRRFQARHQAHSSEALQRLHWPTQVSHESS